MTYDLFDKFCPKNMADSLREKDASTYPSKASISAGSLFAVIIWASFEITDLTF